VQLRDGPPPRGLAVLVAGALSVGVLSGCQTSSGAATTADRTSVTGQVRTSAPADTATASPPATSAAPAPPTAAPPATSSPARTPAAPEPPPVETLELGDAGAPVAALQQRLSALGYWLGTPDGEFGFATQQAVFAVQGAAGLQRDGVVGAKTRQALADGVRPRPRSSTGSVIEIDRDGGLLVFVDEGRPRLILHTSTGTFEEYENEGHTLLADTPEGTWEVSWSHDGWREGALGRLYRPRYFHPDGIAVHGYPSVPAYPASHGCARVSMAAMDMIWQDGLMPRGATVLVY
jgi:N-acetylmuramoyl-L-alanine amidase